MILVLHHRSGDLEIIRKKFGDDFILHHRSGDLEIDVRCQLVNLRLHHRSGDLENSAIPAKS